MMENGGSADDEIPVRPQDEAAQNQVPAGWYPDGAGNQRWWDGQQWAQHVPPAPTQTTDPKTIATVMHISGIFLGFIGPLVGYLVYPEDPFVREHSRNALNFHITVMIGYVISLVLTLILIGFLFFIAIMITTLILQILAAVEANKGNMYKYPLTIEFLKS